MSTTICYYISDYGYGHASRSIAIIRSLLIQSPEIKLLICSGKLFYLKESLQRGRTTNIKFREFHDDCGYVTKKNSIEQDPEAINERSARFVERFVLMVENEVNFLESQNVDLIISDISPIAFPAGKKLGIPTVGISNFTWYTAFSNILEDGRLAKYYEAYQCADYFMHLAGSLEPRWGTKKNWDCEFFCRSLDHDEMDEIRQTIKSGNGIKSVYFSMGMDIDIDLSLLRQLIGNQNMRFIVSKNLELESPFVTGYRHLIPSLKITSPLPIW